MIRRCKWCIARIGAARHFIDDEWQQVFPVAKIDNAEFTDGICPECATKMKEEIQAIKPE